MELNELLNTVDHAPSRPKQCRDYVGAALTLSHNAIEHTGIEVIRSASYKGLLVLEIKRGPVCKLEQEHWPRVFEGLAKNWNTATGSDHHVSVKSLDGWYTSFTYDDREEIF